MSEAFHVRFAVSVKSGQSFSPHVSKRKKKFLSVKVFSTKVLIRDTIFTSLTGDGTRGSTRLQGKGSTFISQLFLRPWVLVPSRETNPRTPALQSSALPTELILPRWWEKKKRWCEKKKEQTTTTTTKKQQQQHRHFFEWLILGIFCHLKAWEKMRLYVNYWSRAFTEIVLLIHNLMGIRTFFTTSNKTLSTKTINNQQQQHIKHWTITIQQCMQVYSFVLSP